LSQINNFIPYLKNTYKRRHVSNGGGSDNGDGGGVGGGYGSGGSNNGEES